MSGKVVDGEFLGPDDSGTAPELPASIDLGEPTTVETPNGSYRVLAKQTSSTAVVVAAIPLSDTNKTLSSCCSSRAS